MMNIETIRNKYKQIFEQSEGEDSEDELQITYTKMEKQIKKHILKESNIINQPIICGENILVKHTKQKQVQTILTNKDKDKQIQQLKRQNDNLKKRNEQLSKQLQSIIISQDQYKIQTQAYKKKNNQLQQQIQALKGQLQSYNIDKQLMLQQVHYYQTENQRNRIESCKIKKQQQQLENIQKMYNSVISQNELLRKSMEVQQNYRDNLLESLKLNIVVPSKKKYKDKSIVKECIKYKQTKNPYYFHKNHQKSIRNPNISITQYHPQKRNKTISFVTNKEMLRKSLIKRKRTAQIDKSMRKSQLKDLTTAQLTNKQNYFKNSMNCKPCQYFSKETTQISQNVGTIQLQRNKLTQPSKHNNLDLINTQKIKKCIGLCKHIILEFQKVVSMIQAQKNKKKSYNYKKIVRLSQWMCQAINKNLQDISNMI